MSCIAQLQRVCMADTSKVQYRNIRKHMKAPTVKSVVLGRRRGSAPSKAPARSGADYQRVGPRLDKTSHKDNKHQQLQRLRKAEGRTRTSWLWHTFELWNAKTSDSGNQNRVQIVNVRFAGQKLPSHRLQCRIKICQRGDESGESDERNSNREILQLRHCQTNSSHLESSL